MALGTEESLRQLTIDTVREFHATHVPPVERDARRLAAISASTTSGRWPPTRSAAGPITRPDVPDDAALAAPPMAPVHRLVLVNKTGAAQSEIRIGEVGLARSTPDYHPLIVLNMILGGQFVSRINMKLRQEKGLTYGARTAFDFRRGRGPFVLQTSVQSDGTAEAITASLLEIHAIRTERPPTVDEVEVAKAALTRGYARNFETAEQIARAMAQLVLYGLAR